MASVLVARWSEQGQDIQGTTKIARPSKAAGETTDICTGPATAVILRVPYRLQPKFEPKHTSESSRANEVHPNRQPPNFFLCE